MGKARTVALLVVLGGLPLVGTRGARTAQVVADVARSAVARYELSVLARAVEADHRMTGDVPADPDALAELAAAVWGTDPDDRLDPWGRPYAISPMGEDAEAAVLRSLGPNGVDDGACATALDVLSGASAARSDDVCVAARLTAEPSVYALLD